LNKRIPTALTPEERRTKLRAQMIRKRFERATETVKQILASMTDAQLVEKEKDHHHIKVGALAAQRQRRQESR
jgi:hypothetical protein